MTQIKTDIESKKAEIDSIEKRRDKIMGELEQCENQANSFQTKLDDARKEYAEHSE